VNTSLFKCSSFLALKSCSSYLFFIMCWLIFLKSAITQNSFNNYRITHFGLPFLFYQ
jgi:hypothetical protein